MAQETAVTAPPIGASRALDWYVNEDGTGLQQALVRGRLVGTTDPSRTSSNGDQNGAGMALTSPYVFTPLQIGGKWVRMCKVQGSMVFNIIPLSTFTPTAKDLGWPQGRYVWEALFHWPAPPVLNNIDSGLVIADVDNARVLGGVLNNGFGLGNRAGVLSFYTRGVGGFDSVDVSAFAGPLNLLNKLTLVVRQPGLNRPASVTALVNDRIVAARSYVGAAHHLPITAAALASLSPEIVHASVATDCYVSQVRFSSGPDVADL